MLRGDGRDGIDAMIKAVHEKYPGHKFTRTSDVDSHNDRARFSWELAPDGGPFLVKGIDFATLRPTDRCARSPASLPRCGRSSDALAGAASARFDLLAPDAMQHERSEVMRR